jgi:hypothetical protein
MGKRNGKKKWEKEKIAFRTREANSPINILKVVL